MNKKNKFFLNKIFFFLIFLLILPKLVASENINFLSLKNSEVNLRLGPSFEYPIKLIYKKKHLPVVILDKSETWRKIIDFENNAGWIHVSQLSRKRSAINTKKNSIIYKKSTIYSKPLAKLEIGRLVIIKKCKLNWCQVISGNYKGWIFKNTLWGNTK